MAYPFLIGGRIYTKPMKPVLIVGNTYKVSDPNPPIIPGLKIHELNMSPNSPVLKQTESRDSRDLIEKKIGEMISLLKTVVGIPYDKYKIPHDQNKHCANIPRVTEGIIKNHGLTTCGKKTYMYVSENETTEYYSDHPLFGESVAKLNTDGLVELEKIVNESHCKPYISTSNIIKDMAIRSLLSHIKQLIAYRGALDGPFGPSIYNWINSEGLNTICSDEQRKISIFFEKDVTQSVCDNGDWYYPDTIIITRGRFYLDCVKKMPYPEEYLKIFKSVNPFYDM